VRKQSGSYEKAFAEHEKRFREEEVKMEEVQRWRQALTQVADLSGWDIQNKSVTFLVSRSIAVIYLSFIMQSLLYPSIYLIQTKCILVYENNIFKVRIFMLLFFSVNVKFSGHSVNRLKKLLKA